MEIVFGQKSVKLKTMFGIYCCNTINYMQEKKSWEKEWNLSIFICLVYQR